MTFQELKAYIQDNPQEYWFKRKLYGWGWVPATWQGALVVLGYLVAITLFALTLNEASPMREIAFTLILPTMILTTALVGICYKKGEKPRWQWGIPSKK